MYFISPFDFWVLSVQKIEFFCIPQSYLTVVEYSTSFAIQKQQIIVCWIDYRFVFPPRLLLRFLFTSFCICMRFLVVMKIVINLHLKMNCDHVSLLLGFVTTIFYFWVLYFFYLFVLAVLKMKFFVVPPAWSDSNFLPRFIILYFNCYY